MKWTLPLLLLVAGGCTHRWLPVVDGMRAQTVLVELNKEEDDYNGKAPPGFAPAQENRWILFFYDPAVDPKSHAAFLRLDRDCFMAEVADEDDEAGGKRHAAVCAYERVPPPPPDMRF